jgi:hypothetical protein
MRIFLLLLAFRGLGDDNLQVRQVSECYLADSGYVVVLLNQSSHLPFPLVDGLRTRAALGRLEERYYAAWDEKLARNDWEEFPSLALLHPYCAHSRPYYARRPHLWDDGWHMNGGGAIWLLRLHYFYEVRAQYQADRRQYAVNSFGRQGFGRFNACTLELFKDLRSQRVPAWAMDGLLGFLYWRNATLEHRYKLKDSHFVRRGRRKSRE